MTFPRTMTKGMFAGRTFDSLSDYQKAVREAAKGKPKKRSTFAAGDTFRFVVTVESGTFEGKVTGDPRSGEDVDKAIALLRAYTPKARPSS